VFENCHKLKNYKNIPIRNDLNALPQTLKFPEKEALNFSNYGCPSGP
jgi:hypothetical protein